MFVNQNSLGEFKTHKPDSFTQLIPGRVVSTVDYEEFKQVAVSFSKGGTTLPVWVVEDGVSPKPVNGDWVLVGFIGGHKNQPYIAGYYRGNYAWSNHIMMRRDETTEEILIQLPVLPELKIVDLEEHLTNDTKKETRAFVHLHTDFAEISFPTGPSSRVSIKADKNGNLTINAPGTVTINGATINLNGGTINLNG